MLEIPAGSSFGVDVFPLSCIATDRSRKIIFANAHVSKYFGGPRDQIVGVDLESFVTPASRIFCDSDVYPILLTGGHCDEVALTMVTEADSRAPVVVNACVHSNYPGSCSGACRGRTSAKRSGTNW